jgi:hypothetical protein
LVVLNCPVRRKIEDKTLEIRRWWIAHEINEDIKTEIKHSIAKWVITK